MAEGAIQYKFSNVQTVIVKKDTVIRYRGGIKSKILTKTAKDTVLRLMNEGEDWDQVATDDGYIGYIQKKKVSAADTTDYKRSFKAEAYSYFTMDEPVNLAWHQVTRRQQLFRGYYPEYDRGECDLTDLVLCFG